MNDAYPLDPVALREKLIAVASAYDESDSVERKECYIEDYLCGWFEAHGLTAHRLPRESCHPNIIGIARGTGGGRSLMFNGSLDRAELIRHDCSPVMTSGLAAMMVAAECAKAAGVAGDILVACAVDREPVRFSAAESVERFMADAAIIMKSSPSDATIAPEALIRFEVKVAGLAADDPSSETILVALREAARGCPGRGPPAGSTPFPTS